VLAGADRQAYSGSQPVVAPLYDTRATVDVLLAAAAAAGGAVKDKLAGYTDEVDYLQKQILPLIQAKGFYTAPEVLTFWSKWQQFGGWWTADAGLEKPDGAKALAQSLDLSASAVSPLEQDQFYLVTFPTQMGDGSGANRPWLQETPDPTTTVTWNTWVEMNPATAKKLDIKDDDIIRISSPAGEIEAVVYRYPAIRPDAIALPFGQGHENLGRYAEKRGANPAKLFEAKTNSVGDLAYGDVRVKITKTGQRRPLARLESREGVYGKEE
jgi:anaerobic selenocysteine-containing dehydrogenase